MCLVIKRSEPLIAEEDINVVKQLCNNLSPAFYTRKPFVYKLGELFKTEILEDDDYTYFDSLDELRLEKETKKHLRNLSWTDIINRLVKKGYASYGPGFHSMSIDRFNKMSSDSEYGTYECVIPKGSEYLKSSDGLYISNQIIIIKEYEQ